MVTDSCRIGYDRSSPDGPLTMKLADTPSRRAGLIISVFGVASSPMASLLAEHRPPGGAASVRGREGTVKERLELGDSRVELRGPTARFEARRRASRFDVELRVRASTARFEVDCEVRVRRRASSSSFDLRGSRSTARFEFDVELRVRARLRGSRSTARFEVDCED